MNRPAVLALFGVFAAGVSVSGSVEAQSFSLPPSKPPAVPEVSPAINMSMYLVRARGMAERAQHGTNVAQAVEDPATGNIYFLGRTTGDLLVLPSLQSKPRK